MVIRRNVRNSNVQYVMLVGAFLGMLIGMTSLSISVPSDVLLEYSSAENTFYVGDNLYFDYSYEGHMNRVNVTWYEYKGINSDGMVYFEYVDRVMFGGSTTSTAVFDDVVSFAGTPYNFVITDKQNGYLKGYFSVKDGEVVRDGTLFGGQVLKVLYGEYSFWHGLLVTFKFAFYISLGIAFVYIGKWVLG